MKYKYKSEVKLIPKHLPFGWVDSFDDYREFLVDNSIDFMVHPKHNNPKVFMIHFINKEDKVLFDLKFC